MDNNIWQRPYFERADKSAMLFYVVYGVENIELNLSKSKHNITGLPNDIQITSYSKDKPEQKEYLESFYSDYLGQLLLEKDEQLHQITQSVNSAAIISLEIADQDNLEYLRNTIGLVQCIVEQGAVSVFDMQTITWFNADEWSRTFFEPRKEQVLKEVIILFSNEENGYWLHTRGMRKFSRPDISITAVSEDSFNLAKELTERFIIYFASGSLPDENKAIVMNDLKHDLFGKIKGGYYNLDFNNYFFEIDWANRSAR